MTRQRRNSGLTLIEILLAVAIVVVLATIMTVSGGNLRRQAMVRLTESTFSVVSSALQQYYESGGKYPPQFNDPSLATTYHDPAIAVPSVYYDTASATRVQTPLQAIAAAANYPVGTAIPTGNTVVFRVFNKNTIPPLAVNPTFADVNPVGAKTVPDAASVSSEALYIYLAATPVSRSVISKLSDKCIADEYDTANNPFILKWTKSPATLSVMTRIVNIVDAWGTPIRYQYKTGDQFPVLVSAGPDKTFGTNDDVRSTGK